MPPCLEGQVLDEESGLCVLEEPEAAEEPPAEEEQPSEDSGSEDNSNNWVVSLYGPDKSYINQLAYYMTITGAKKGQLLYVLLTNNDENPFRAYDVTVLDEERARTKQRLIRETMRY